MSGRDVTIIVNTWTVRHALTNCIVGTYTNSWPVALDGDTREEVSLPRRKRKADVSGLVCVTLHHGDRTIYVQRSDSLCGVPGYQPL